MACRTALLSSSHRCKEGLGGKAENTTPRVVIGLSYSEKLNYSDKRHRYQYKSCSLTPCVLYSTSTNTKPGPIIPCGRTGSYYTVPAQINRFGPIVPCGRTGSYYTVPAQIKRFGPLIPCGRTGSYYTVLLAAWCCLYIISYHRADYTVLR